ncbi:MAG TPA: xanthine dehydrogenase family protein subunit M [Actinomycetota bacterium]|nr:xanthine dehydrogenase family protein subunit M [Actinomycetota bacterium]
MISARSLVMSVVSLVATVVNAGDGVKSFCEDGRGASMHTDSARLARRRYDPGTLKPPPFDYVPATSVDEAHAALADAGEDAQILAGGQSLIPLLSLRLAHPSTLVDVNGVEELASMESVDGALRIGATVRHRTVERSQEAGASIPLLAEAMPLIGHVAIRSRGTIGGSLAHADPAAELPAIAVALGATFTVRSRDRGERTIGAEDFFQGYFTTAIEPDELLCSIDFPVLPARSGCSIEEVARRHGDFALVGVVAAVTLDEHGTIGDARIAIMNVADRAVRATAAEQAIVGMAAAGATFGDAASAAGEALDPPGDLHASPAYRRKVAGVCVRRALERATRRALEAV